jgi:hypothetical protein
MKIKKSRNIVKLRTVNVDFEKKCSLGKRKNRQVTSPLKLQGKDKGQMNQTTVSTSDEFVVELSCGGAEGRM